MATISQRISLEGSEDILKQLAELGKTGEQAFKRIQDAAKKPITDPAQIDKTKQAINELAVAGAKLGPQFQELANSTQKFGTQGEQAARQVTVGLNQTSAAAQQAGSTIQQAAQQASSAGAQIGVTLAKAAVVFGIAATGIAAAISAVTSALTKGAVETGTAVADQANKISLAIPQWLELRKAIRNSTISNDDFLSSAAKVAELMGTAQGGISRLSDTMTEQAVKTDSGTIIIRRFNDSVTDTTSAASKAASELGQLGVGIGTIASGDVLGALRKVAQSISQIPDALKRAEAGTTVFGKNWQEVIKVLLAGQKVTDDAAKSIAEVGKANRDLSGADVEKTVKLKAAWDDLSSAIRATKDLIGSLFLDPALLRAQWLVKLVDGSRELLRTWLGLDQLKRQAFLAGLDSGSAETAFKLLVALGEQLAGIWRDILVPAGEKLIEIVRGIAQGFGNVTATRVAAFFIVAAIAVTGFLIALRGIAFLLGPITAFLSLFGGFGPVLLGLAAAAVFFWDKLKAGASKALALIPREVQEVRAAFALLFQGDFSGFWEKFSTAAVSAFAKLKQAVLEASGVIPDLLRAITGTGEIEIPWIKTLAEGIAQIGSDAPGVINAVVGAMAALGRAATFVADTINGIFGTKLTGTDVGVILILAQITGALQAAASIAVIAGVAFGGLVRVIGLLVVGIGGLPAVILLAAAALAGIIVYLDPKVWDFYADAAKRAMALISPAIQPVLDLIARLTGLLSGGGSGASAWDIFRNAALSSLNPIVGAVRALLNLIDLVVKGLEAIGLKTPAGGAPAAAPPSIQDAPTLQQPPPDDIKKRTQAIDQQKQANERLNGVLERQKVLENSRTGIQVQEQTINNTSKRIIVQTQLENVVKTFNEAEKKVIEESNKALRDAREARKKAAEDPTTQAGRDAAIEAGRKKAEVDSQAAAAARDAARASEEAAAAASRAADEEAGARQRVLDIINETIQKLEQQQQQQEEIPLPRPRPPGALQGDQPTTPDDRASLVPGGTNIPSHLWGSPGFNPRIPVEIDIIPKPPIEVPIEPMPKPPIEVPIEITPKPPIDVPINIHAPGADAVVAARGGLLHGRGTGTSDSNLAWLSHGEHIMPAKAVRQPGVLAFLEALRRSGGNLQRALDGVDRFALGGLAPRSMNIPAFANGGLNGSTNNVTIQFPGLPAIGGLRASSDVVDELRKAAALAQVRSGGRKPSRYS